MKRCFKSKSLPDTLTKRSAVISNYGEPRCVKRINQYLRLNMIGSGSYSKVYLCQDTDTGSYYALKRIHLKQLQKSPEGIWNIRREIEMMRRISCLNIVSLQEVIYAPEKDVLYLILEYADCGSLAKVSKSYDFTPDEIRYIFKQIAEGVAYLHELRIVNQDLKPQNILLCHDWTALISDFGIGHTFQSSAKVIGTPAFQAPEIIDQEYPEEDIDPGKEDIWSLGVTLYNLAFNEFPYDGDSVYEIVNAINTQPLKRPNGCSDCLWNLLKGMLNVDPSNRFDIYQVCAHEYVVNAPAIDNNKLIPNQVNGYDASLPIQQVDGIVCEEYEYPFISETQLFRSSMALYISHFPEIV